VARVARLGVTAHCDAAADDAAADDAAADDAAADDAAADDAAADDAAADAAADAPYPRRPPDPPALPTRHRPEPAAPLNLPPARTRRCP
jgi:hypothetical protein